MATNSLPQSTFQPVSATAVHVLARLAARKAVTEQLRAEGVRVSLAKPAEISARAQVYLADHPGLYREALERAQRLGLYEKRRRRRTMDAISTPPRPRRIIERRCNTGKSQKRGGARCQTEEVSAVKFHRDPHDPGAPRGCLRMTKTNHTTE